MIQGVLPGTWVAELLGVQDHKKIKIPLRVYSSMAAKGLRRGFHLSNVFLNMTIQPEMLEQRNPSKHTTLFQRPSDVHNGQMTFKRRQKNVKG